MNIKEIVDQINYVMDEVEDTPDKYRQLHELGWQHQYDETIRLYEDKEQAMKEQLVASSLRTKMMSELCRDCGEDTSFGSGKFVNRISRHGWSVPNVCSLIATSVERIL